MPKLLML